ncbi:hypothetical protein GGI12_005049 [Dipsacomyces acuminosporus]|nr:hypothetical protein GGI12_005049 [Dipsacomyces acuminosporus]
MLINDLEYDILYEIVSWIYSYNWPFGKYSRRHSINAISHVCQLWREIALPLKYKTIYVEYTKGGPMSNALAALKCGYVRYAKVLELDIQEILIEELDLAGTMERVGIAEATWPQITKLKISNEYEEAMHTEGDLAFKGDAATAKALMAFFRNHMPNIEDIEFIDAVFNDTDMERDFTYIYSLITGLFETYATKVRNASLNIDTRQMVNEFWFPTQLTHLVVNMRSYERRMLPKILAPSLKCLSIIEASPDITWSWFYSSDNDNNNVWFNNLKQLEIEFFYFDAMQSYHSGDLATYDVSALMSDYKEDAKHVHFPVLEFLELLCYPYKDDSFYRVFEGCPLRKLSTGSPLDARHCIPPSLLANLDELCAMPEFDPSVYNAGERNRATAISHEKFHEMAFAKLLSTPSTVRSAILEMHPSYDTISLPEQLAWSEVRKLDLRLRTDMRSIFAILAQMPKLRCLRFSLSKSYLHSEHCGHYSTVQLGEPDQHEQNKSVELLHINFRDNRPLTKGCLQFCLSKILPLVPRLLKLKVNATLVDMFKEVVTDLDSSSQPISKVIEVVSGE